MSYSTRPTVRELLRANRTYYVRTDGSDTSSGLLDAAGGAFLTISRALAVAAGIDFGGYVVTIQVRAGTRTEGVTIPYMTGQVTTASLIIVGDIVTPGNVIQSPTGGDCFAAGAGARASIRGFKLQTTTSGACLFATGPGAEIEYQAVDFGVCAAEHTLAFRTGAISRTGSVTISGGATRHLRAVLGGTNYAQTGVGTLTGTPAFSTAFIQGVEGGSIRTAAGSWTGAATGVRYLADTAGGIQTFGAGASGLPGNSAGTATSPGWYA
jgi:hypothetical protein